MEFVVGILILSLWLLAGWTAGLADCARRRVLYTWYMMLTHAISGPIAAVAIAGVFINHVLSHEGGIDFRAPSKAQKVGLSQKGQGAPTKSINRRKRKTNGTGTEERAKDPSATEPGETVSVFGQETTVSGQIDRPDGDSPKQDGDQKPSGTA